MFKPRRSTGLASGLWLAALLLALVPIAPAPAQAQSGHEAWSYNLGVYEINIRNFTQEGTFAAAETHLDRLADLGVGILWLMPIHPIGVQQRLGSLGSPYSVRDYLAVHPQYGTRADLQRFVHAAHERGMYVILDWVANHTAWDAVLTEEHPEWYVTNASGSFIPPPGTNWSDVIELDYAQPDLRAYMIDAMRFWVDSVGVDGFRFDAVDFVPMDFWREATAALKSARSDLFLLAEGPAPEYHAAGFDATHAWSFYGFGGGVAKRIADDEVGATALIGFVAQEARDYPDEAYRLLFTSNHDENAWHGTPTELFGAGADAFAVLSATLDGLPLIYMGQEAGLNRRLAFFDRDPITWRSHENETFYRTLLQLKRRNAALWNGRLGGAVEWIRTNVNNDVFAFWRASDGHRVVVFTNLSDAPQQPTFDATAFAGTYRDVFRNDVHALSGSEELVLEPWSYRVLEQIQSDTRSEGTPGAGTFGVTGLRPNPASSTTSVAYVLSAATGLRITLFDVLGRELETLLSEPQSAGSHTLQLDVSGLRTGTYFVHLDAGSWTDQAQIVVVR